MSDRPAGGYSSPSPHLGREWWEQRRREQYANGGYIASGRCPKIELTRCDNCDLPIFLASDDEYTDRLHACSPTPSVEHMAELEGRVRALMEQLAESQRHEAQWKEKAQRSETYAEETLTRFEELESAGVDFLQFIEQHGTKEIARKQYEPDLFRLACRLVDAVRVPIKLVKTHD